MSELEKSNIKVADMNKEMINEVIETAKRAIEKYEIERDIAKYIKDHFDRYYYPNWHCIVGRHYASIITYESRHYINLVIGEVEITLFKFG